MNDINIAALLKDCPKGTRLYSPICGECTLRGFFDKTKLISVTDAIGNGWNFTKEGYSSASGECLLFPSKEVRSWGCFHAKYAWGGDGITESTKIQRMLIENGGIGLEDGLHNCNYPNILYYIDVVTHVIKISGLNVERNYIISTGTELKLEEKEEPKFNVGDVVKYDNIFHVVVGIDGIRVTIDNEPTAKRGVTYVDNLTLATPEEIAKWNEETLHPNHLHYSKSKRKIVHWFLPFDKVVVRSGTGKWSCGFFCYYNIRTSSQPYKCIGAIWEECLPYNEQTAKLIGTTDDYKE